MRLFKHRHQYQLLLFSVFLYLIPYTISGQFDGALEENEESIFVDGVSPILLERGEIEVSNTSSLISYWNKIRLVNIDGGIFNNTYRLSLFQNKTSISYGFSESNRWDLGAEIVYVKRRWDDNANSSPFKVFSGDELNTSGLAYLGIKGRFQPFESIPGLTLQALLRLPVANGEQLRRDLQASSMQFSLFTTYYTQLNYGTALLLQGGWSYTLPKTIEESGVRIRPNHALSLGGFMAVNLFGQKIYAVPGLTYSGNFRKSARSSSILQLSHGVFGEMILQFQLGGNATLNLQQSYPFLFESYSPTVEFERRSFTLTTLGIRVIL